LQTMVNPTRFVAQEISLCPLSRGQSAVVLGGLRIGRVSHAPAAEGRLSWLWSLTGPHCDGVPSGLPTCGEAATLTEAKLQLRHSFDAWLGWALDQQGPVHWHWTEATAPRPADEESPGGRLLAAE
jgi:hypothetical protein